MKVRIIYVENHKKSEIQANQSLKSFKKHGWDARLYPGITPKKLDKEDTKYPYEPMKGSRLEGFKEENYKVYLIKRSCILNHLNFCSDVIESGETQALVEHDTICVGPWNNYDIDEFCFLSYQYALNPPSILSTKTNLKNYKLSGQVGVNKFPDDWPLKIFKKNSVYHNCKQVPGTGAYILSPKGAEKIIKSVDKYGLEQSDFMFNEKNIKLEYVWPSPVKYDKINLNLSHKLKE